MRSFFSAVLNDVFFSVILVLAAACPSRGAMPQTETNRDTTTANLVHAALSCELAGRNDQRETLLIEAVKQSPDDPMVHWLLGEVQGEDKGEWLTVSQVELAARKDRRLAEYRRRRDAAGPALSGQIALAQWCRKNKLADEERVHWLLVLQMQPNYPEAVRRLDQQRRLLAKLANEQIAQSKAQPQKTGAPPEGWRSFVAKWRQAFDRGETAPPPEFREKSRIFPIRERWPACSRRLDKRPAAKSRSCIP